MMIVYGASGHGKVIIDILELNAIRDIKIWDDVSKAPLSGYYTSSPDPASIDANTFVIISIGNNLSRKKVVKRLPQNTKYHTAIHPKASVSKSVSIGDGSVLMSGASVNPDTFIGKHCIVNTNASIDHDCMLGDFVHVSPNATLCGNVSVGEGSHIGAGAIVIPGVKIGKWCVVGAGSVVIKDIPDNVTVVGNPAKVISTSTKE